MKKLKKAAKPSAQDEGSSLTLRDDEGSTIKRVADLGLSSRTVRCLEVANIRTVKALAKKKPEELLAIEGFGKKTLDEVLGKLEEHGFTPHGDVEALTLQTERESTTRKRQK